MVWQPPFVVAASTVGKVSVEASNFSIIASTYGFPLLKDGLERRKHFSTGFSVSVSYISRNGLHKCLGNQEAKQIGHSNLISCQARETASPSTSSTTLVNGEPNRDTGPSMFNRVDASSLPPKHYIALPRLGQNFWESILRSTPYSSLETTPSTPAPPFTGGLISLLGLVLVLGVIFDRWISQASRGIGIPNVGNVGPEKASNQLKAPTGISVFLERDLRKESVEWVNMVLGKLWKVYRMSLETWIVGLLQPLIDNLQKPSYVEKVEIKQFYLGDEPISVRSVERRASRRANDVQYHIGLRYTGGARMLLYLKLKAGFIPRIIPVVVRGLDVDGELWLKLRLVPSVPWVAAATWAFVSLPRIKLNLSPFRFFNLMAIPFVSVFLTNLLTQDLPQLFVRPKKNVINFLKGGVAGAVPKDFSGATLDRFSGELSVTLVDARNLNRVPYGKVDPYVVLVLGDQVIKSKRNSQTSVVGPPGSPIWNQDFLLLVDSKNQRLAVQVWDYFGLTTVSLGVGEVDLSALPDTVPADRVVRLTGGWGLFGKRFAGEVVLRLTYTAYIDDEEDEVPDLNGYASGTEENPDDLPLFNGRDSYLTDMFEAVIAELNSEGLESGDTNNETILKDDKILGFNLTSNNDNKNSASNQAQTADRRTTLVWLGLVTGLVILVDISLNFSNLLNP